MGGEGELGTLLIGGCPGSCRRRDGCTVSTMTDYRMSASCWSISSLLAARAAGLHGPPWLGRRVVALSGDVARPSCLRLGPRFGGDHRTVRLMCVWYVMLAVADPAVSRGLKAASFYPLDVEGVVAATASAACS